VYSIANSLRLRATAGALLSLSALLRPAHSVAADASRGNDTSQPTQEAPDAVILRPVQVRAKRVHDISPLPGSALGREQIPGNVQSLTAEQIRDSHALSITDLFNQHLQSVNVNDYQSNPFQMDVTYRGFSAGPQIGTPQGLSVFIDGIRVNEPFGDVVNWDMLPLNALAGVDVFPGSNPIFGLNTLGGAFSLKTKDGFGTPGFDAEVLTGSHGRQQLQMEAGTSRGNFALFGAANLFMEDGWRDNSPSDVNQYFGKASFRSEPLDLDFTALLADNDLVGNGLVPTQMYEQRRRAVFTSPDRTFNRLQQFQLSGAWHLGERFNVTAQVYRRDSRRHANTGDVYTDYEGTSNTVNRNLAPGEQFTCLYNSTNKYGLPDYYIIDVPDNDFSRSEFIVDYFNNGRPDFSLLPPGAFNQDLPDYFAAHAVAEFNFWKAPINSIFYRAADDDLTKVLPPFGGETPYSNGEVSYIFSGASVSGNFESTGDDSPINPLTGLAGFFWYTPDGVKHLFTPIKAINGEQCRETQGSSTGNVGDVRYLNPFDPQTGDPQVVDGGGSLQPGVVDGTPTAVLTDNRIDQVTEGASLQLNWNLGRHSFMFGGSIDMPKATYGNSQRLGLLDAKRNAYLAPDQIRDQYAAADQDIRNNDFTGRSITRSLYASETWTVLPNLNLTASARYNITKGRTTLAQRLKGESYARLAYYQNIPYSYDVCINGVCPATGYRPPALDALMQQPETETARYQSFNPSIGAAWQVTPTLNLFANWAEGVRTPSVIELGCAFDHTLIDIGPKYDEHAVEIGRNVLERSLAEGRSCQLPSTLSGDPYLPQIKARTLDLGVRGNVAGSLPGDAQIEWNLGLYRTSLKDDIYLITFPGNRNFFDTIGRTRRQGIEGGISAQVGKAGMSLNYALTDATFESSFRMAAEDNSSATIETSYCNPDTNTCLYPDDAVGRILVEPGDRMPGIPLHNLNASVSYEIAAGLEVGVSAIAHSRSYLRGNENNEHQPGVVRYVQVAIPDPDQPGRFLPSTVARPPTTNEGSVPGHATFNFLTSYRINRNWMTAFSITNLFDKEYSSAGRLGRNPFSPGILGAVGPGGYNHNSSDWLSTNFVSPGAPRAFWLSARAQFGALE
jgi:outer membrane receptor protein involved in Fe transport